jgi:hydroxyacylglutathione hydrolase
MEHNVGSRGQDPLEVIPVPAFRDNYIWLIRRGSSVAIVDPGDAAPVLKVLRANGLRPVAILITHHHSDHVGGIADLLKEYPIPVFGPVRESIPHRTHALDEGDEVYLPEIDIRFEILDVPGHTAGAITYHGVGLLFAGDTLFSAGCGRLFEGTAAQMYRSLTKLAGLPPSTQLFCGHEYTLANLAFAATVEPENAAIHRRTQEARSQRASHLATLPSSLEVERLTNPFLRCDLPSIELAAEKYCGRRVQPGAETFSVIRSWKDSF